MTSTDKRFLGILGVVTLIAAGGLIYWGMRGGSRYDESADDYQAAAATVSRLERLKPYPNDQNLNSKTGALKEYRASLGKVQEGFEKFRPPALDNISSAAFGARLLEVSGKAKEELTAAGTGFPDNFALGFEAYTSKLATQNATGLMGYQLDAIGDLFHLLAEARPSALINFVREPMPEETGGEYEPKGDEIARSLSMEITFQGPEAALRSFLNSLVASDKHYYVVRSLRIANERQTGPTAEEAKFKETKPAVVDPFAGSGFAFPGADEEEAPFGEGTGTPAEGGEPAGGEAPAEAPAPDVPEKAPAAGDDDANRILKQLVGDEEVEVFLRLDLMLFHDNIELPQP